MHPSRFMGTVGGKVVVEVNSSINEANPLLPLLTVAETKDCEILEGIPAEVDLVGQEDRLEEDLEGHLEDHLEDDPEGHLEDRLEDHLEEDRLGEAHLGPLADHSNRLRLSLTPIKMGCSILRRRSGSLRHSREWRCK